MFAALFVRRPRLAVVISLILLLAGALAAFLLPIAEYPVVAPPGVYVTAKYPGASAQAVADAVGAPIESQVNGVEDVAYFSSNSDNAGHYTLTVTFRLGADEDMALVNVNNAIRRAEHLLPQEVVAEGITATKRTADVLCYVVLRSTNPDDTALDVSNWADVNVRDEFLRLEGVSDVVLYGEKKYAMRVWLDPVKLRACGISVADVRAAVVSQNMQPAAGAVGTEGASADLQFKIDAGSRLRTPEEFAAIVVRSAERGVRQVRLGDVAKIELGAEKNNLSPILDGDAAVCVAVFKLVRANALDVRAAVDRTMRRIEKDFPPGFVWSYQQDQTRFVRASMKEISETLVVTLVLVVLITGLFLGSVRATLIPAVAIPVSLAGSFILLKAFGLGINTLTMFAFVLVIGSVVDNAICVTEGAMAKIGKGLAPAAAAVATMRELSGALVASTLVVVAVYLPVAFASGMMGTLYRQFSFTMCAALVLSLLVAVTLSSAMAAHLLRPRAPMRGEGAGGRFAKLGERLRDVFARPAAFLLRHAVLAVLLLAAFAASTVWLVRELPAAFVPEEDKRQIFFDVVLPSGSAQERTKEVLHEIAARVKGHPAISTVWEEPGFSLTAGEGENCGFVFIDLTDWSRRKAPELAAGALIREFTEAFRDFKDAQVLVLAPPALQGFGEAGGVTFSLEATAGQSTEEIVAACSNLVSALERGGKVRSAFAALENDTPILRFDLDRAKAEAMGAAVGDVYQTLQSYLGGDYASDFNRGGKTYQVKLQAGDAARSDVGALDLLSVSGGGGAQIPLAALGEFRWTKGPRRIERFNLFASAAMSVQPAAGVSTGEMMAEIGRAVATELGKGYRIGWTDLSYQESEAAGNLTWLFALSVAMAYLFLVGQYESWTAPIAVVLSIVPAAFGAMLALRAGGRAFDLYAQLGVLMIVGLMAKTAILMVELSLARVREGASAARAALAGFRLRFRAVMMTALSFVIGALPLLFATGAGAGARQSVGVTTFWGMFAGSFVGILFIPAVFALVCRSGRGGTRALP